MMWTVCLGLGQQHPPLLQIQRKTKKMVERRRLARDCTMDLASLRDGWAISLSLPVSFIAHKFLCVCVFLLPRGDENKEPSFHSIYYVVVERRRRHVWVFSSGWRYVRAVSLTVHSPDNGRVEKQKRHCFVCMFVCLFTLIYRVESHGRSG